MFYTISDFTPPETRSLSSSSLKQVSQAARPRHVSSPPPLVAYLDVLGDVQRVLWRHLHGGDDRLGARVHVPHHHAVEGRLLHPDVVDDLALEKRDGVRALAHIQAWLLTMAS